MSGATGRPATGWWATAGETQANWPRIMKRLLSGLRRPHRAAKAGLIQFCLKPFSLNNSSSFHLSGLSLAGVRKFLPARLDGILTWSSPMAELATTVDRAPHHKSLLDHKMGKSPAWVST